MPPLPQHALPYELNKLNLDTLGETDMAGLLAASSGLAANFKVLPVVAPSANSPATDSSGWRVGAEGRTDSGFRSICEGLWGLGLSVRDSGVLVYL